MYGASLEGYEHGEEEPLDAYFRNAVGEASVGSELCQNSHREMTAETDLWFASPATEEMMITFGLSDFRNSGIADVVTK